MSAEPPSKIFVTGGRGRLATLIADHCDSRVLLFSRAGAPRFRALDDLLEPAALATASAVLHLAWSTLPLTSEQQPGHEQAHDLPWLARLLDALAATPADRRPHFVFFSTGGAVYGNAPGRPSREDDECRPVGHYGRAKLAAESLILDRAARHELACAVLRISNPYGYPVPKHRTQGLIPHALRCAMERQVLSLWGDGSARKDFIYYTDFLRAIDAVLERRLTGVFNVAAGESHSVAEVLAAVEATTDRQIVLAPQPAPAWDVRDSRIDNSKLCTATGWRPQVSLAEGIRRAAAGYATHEG